MLQIQEKTTLIQTEQLSADTMRISLRAPNIARMAKPGQFVMVRVGESSDPLLRRPFSLHKVTSEGDIEIYFRIVGRGTAMLAEMSPGKLLDVLGPLGHGFDIHEEGRACIIGGGIGIAPMAFLAKELVKRKGFSANDLILLGGRSGGDVEPIAGDFAQYGMEMQVATDDGSYGYHGRVTDILEKHTLPADTTLYACGPEAMLAAVSRYASDHNLRCQVSVESVMACGIGVCLGCNRPTTKNTYAHVCVDGPVFDARELQWNR